VGLSNDFIKRDGTHPGREWRIRKLSSGNISRSLLRVRIIE
jgi:hypothetical protein